MKKIITLNTALTKKNLLKEIEANEAYVSTECGKVAPCVIADNGGRVSPDKMPKVAHFKIEDRGLVGGFDKLHTRKGSRYALLLAIVKPNGQVAELSLASQVAYNHGTKVRCEFATYQEALAAGLVIKRTWGFPIVEAVKEPKAKKQTKADLEKEIAELRAEIARAKAA